MQKRINWLKEFNASKAEFDNFNADDSAEGMGAEGMGFDADDADGFDFDAAGRPVKRRIAAPAQAGKVIRFAVTITNPTTGTIATAAGINLFNSWVNRTATNSGLAVGLTATSKGAITYNQLLALSEAEAFEVSETLIETDATTITAITGLTITSVDGSGESHTRVIDTFRRPDQFTTNQIIVDERYKLDGGTGITLPVTALTTGISITIRLTLSKRGSSANAVFGGKQVSQYQKGTYLLKGKK